MTEIFNVPLNVLLSQLTLGLVNGSFYAVLSLGLAVIFGLLNVVNFAHGAFYMMGAYGAWMLLNYAGVGYFWSLALAPVTVGLIGIIVERTLLRWVYKLDHLYGMLLTFGLSLIIEGLYREGFGVSGEPFAVPDLLRGAADLGFMKLPIYRAWVVAASLAICITTWYIIERTKLGSTLRAATENAKLVQAFGVNVPVMVTLTYGCGVALSALAGVLAVPLVQANPLMGGNIIITVFAVVVIGGMGSIFGSVVTGLALGVLEALAKVFYPEASSTVVFFAMVLVLLAKPAGLFGKGN